MIYITSVHMEVLSEAAFMKHILAFKAYPGTSVCATGTLSSKENTQPTKSVLKPCMINSLHFASIIDR